MTDTPHESMSYDRSGGTGTAALDPHHADDVTADRVPVEQSAADVVALDTVRRDRHPHTRTDTAADLTETIPDLTAVTEDSHAPGDDRESVIVSGQVVGRPVGLCHERCFRPDTPGCGPAGWAL